MKKVFLFIGMLLVIFTLASCGKKYDIVFWHAWGKEKQKVVEDALKNFKKETGLSVKQVSKGQYNELESAVNKALPAGNHPDVVMVYPDHVAGYNSRGERILDLMPLVKGENGFTEEELNDFYTSYLDEGKAFAKPNSLFVLPLAKSSEVMFYNKTFFKRHNLTVPQTWEEVKSLTKVIYEKIAADKKINVEKAKKDYRAMSCDSADNLMITSLEQMKIKYTSIVDGEGVINFVNPETNRAVVDVYREFRKMYEDRVVLTRSENNDQYFSSDFTDQKIMMSVGSTAGIIYNEPVSNKKAKFEVGIAKIPQFDLDNPKNIQQGPSIAIFDKGKEQNAKSWKLVKYLTSTDVNAKVAGLNGYMPVRKSSFQSEFFKKEILSRENGTNQLESLRAKVFKIQNETAELSFTSPVFPGSSKARKEIGKAFHEIMVLDKAKYGDTDEKQIAAIQNILKQAKSNIEN